MSVAQKGEKDNLALRGNLTHELNLIKISEVVSTSTFSAPCHMHDATCSFFVFLSLASCSFPL